MAGTVIVGQCRIPGWADENHLAQGLALLSPHLQPEIGRYLRLADRLARLTARLLIRNSLKLLGLEGEGALGQWEREPGGRPYLRGSRAGISLSHANPWAVAAVGIEGRIGIDVELFRPLDLEAILPYLTPAERERVLRGERPEEEALHCWSWREAVLKADGRGLLAPEAEIREIAKARTAAGLPWAVESLAFGGGCLYLARERAGGGVRREEWDFRELIGG